jgi:hypothetical protein
MIQKNSFDYFFMHLLCANVVGAGGSVGTVVSVGLQRRFLEPELSGSQGMKHSP